MTKKAYIELKKERDLALEKYNQEPVGGKDRIFYYEEYARLFQEVLLVEKKNPNFKIQDEIIKRESIVVLEDTMVSLKFTYEREFNSYGNWETSSEGVVSVVVLGGGAYGYSNCGWNIMQGEYNQMEVLSLSEVKIKLRTYKVNLKNKKIK